MAMTEQQRKEQAAKKAVAFENMLKELKQSDAVRGKQLEELQRTLNQTAQLLAGMAINGGFSAEDLSAAAVVEADSVELESPRSMLTPELAVLYDNVLENRTILQSKLAVYEEALSGLPGDTHSAVERLESVSNRLDAVLDQLKELREQREREEAARATETQEARQRELIEQEAARQRDVISSQAAGFYGPDDADEMEYVSSPRARLSDRARNPDRDRGPHRPPRGKRGGTYSPAGGMFDDEEYVSVNMTQQLGMQVSSLRRDVDLLRNLVDESVKNVASVGVNISESFTKGIAAAQEASEAAEKAVKSLEGSTASVGRKAQLAVILSGVAAGLSLLNLVATIVCAVL